MIQALSLLSLLLLWPLAASAFVHPGVLNSQAELDLIRQKVAAGAQPWKGAYDSIPSYLNYTPKAQAVFSGVTTTASCNPMNAFFEDGNAAYVSALRWVVNGNQAEANKAIQILNAWANADTTFQGDNQVTLCVSWYSPRWAYAAEIMKHYGNSGWTSGAQTTFRNWLNARIVPKLQSVCGGQTTCDSSGGTSRNNWAALGAGARTALGVYLDNQSLYDSGVKGYRALVRFQISKFGHDVLDGFHYETCRLTNSNGGLEGGDLPHTSMSFMGLTTAAEVAKHQGVNLYGYAGDDDNFSLRTAVLAHGQWWWHPDRNGSTKAGWPCDVAFPGLYSDTPFNPQAWHTLYNHYRDSLLLNLSTYQGTSSNLMLRRNIAIPWDRLTHNYTGQVTPAPPPTINTFSASPATVTSGNASTLTCDATGADSGCVIDQGVGSCCASASACDASPTKSTGALTATRTFTLTCTNANGNDTAQTTVTVDPVGPTINVFSANPSTIPQGNSTTLSWDATNATTGCSINQAIGQVCANATACETGGTTVHSPTTTTTYTMTCTNASGPETATATVNVTSTVGLHSTPFASQTGTGTDCTQANPCSITEATTNAAPGAIISLIGTITTTAEITLPSGLSANQPTILQSATTGSPVTVGANGISSTPGTATLQASTATILRLAPTRQFVTVRRLNFTTTGGGANPVIIGGASSGTVLVTDVVLEDLEIQAPTRTGTGACLQTFSNTARWQLRRVRVHRCGPAVNVANLTPTFHGTELRGDDYVIEDSDFYDNSGHGLQIIDNSGTTTINDRAQIRRNRSFGNGYRGVFFGNGTDMVVTQNVAYANGAQGFYTTNPTVRYVHYRNTAHANSQQTGTSLPGIFVNTNATGILRNNIAMGHPGAEYGINPTAPAIACSDNLSSDASETATCTAMELNAVVADVFIDPTNVTLASRNYRLKAGSVAIDNGTTGICTSTDVSATRCTPTLTLNTYQGVAPDQGAYESAAPVLPQTVSRYLMNNTVADDLGPNDGLAINTTFDPTNKMEGSHSALFDAASDAIEIPLAGFSRQAFTIALSARATAFGSSRPTYLFGHTSDYTGGTYRDRIQVYLTQIGNLAVGIGGSHTTIPSAYPFELNTFERVVIVVQEGAVSGSGTVRAYVAGVLRSTASYSGLTQIGPYAHIGNNGATQAEGWLGQIDVVKIDNYAWTQTDVTADCATYCTPSVVPFDPIAPTNCTLGPVAANVIECDLTGQPDPSACNVPTDFIALYDLALQTTTACTITGSNPAHLTVTLAANATPSTRVELVYEPQGTEEYGVLNLLGPQTFEPLEVTSCVTDASGIIITCETIVQADPGLCQNLANFRVTENCIPVNITGCAISSTTLSLQRSRQPVSATVPLALELQQEVQVIAIQNGFVPGTPPGE